MFTEMRYKSEKAARRYLEQVRWPDGRPECPHCQEKRASRIKGKSVRPGVWFCGGCRTQFTVTVGTVFERSKIPLHKWLLANHLLAASKKGMSAHQLHRMLGVTYKTAWFMAHRIREAMKSESPEPMGGPGSIVQADETYFGHKAGPRKPGKSGHPRGPANKRAIVSLVSGGKARTFHVKSASAKTVRRLLVENVSRKSELHTDESRIYVRVGGEFADHKTVVHSANRYVGKDGQNVNACENYFSIFKRGMRGVYQHCSEKHLQRYVDEFDFRFNNRDVDDSTRAGIALQGISGKRLTYGGSQARQNV